MEFYKILNGVPYSLESSSICHAIWVPNVVWSEDGLPPFGHTELPTCFERMVESIDGVNNSATKEETVDTYENYLGDNNTVSKH